VKHAFHAFLSWSWAAKVCSTHNVSCANWPIFSYHVLVNDWSVACKLLITHCQMENPVCLKDLMLKEKVYPANVQRFGWCVVKHTHLLWFFGLGLRLKWHLPNQFLNRDWQ
jgi:hypothetical protein